MFRLICALLLLSAAAVHASTTAAWKVPVELYASLSEEGSRKLPAPPGASVFFQPGDELWDIAEQVMEHSPASLHDRGEKPEPWPGEWLVWNARSGMIVARGSETDLLLLDQTLDVWKKIPLHVRTTFELLQGTSGEVRKLTFLSKGESVTRVKLQELQAEAGLYATSEPNTSVDLDLSISWPRAEGTWKFATKIGLPDGKRTSIAKHISAEEPWELFVTASREWFHAVPYGDIRWKEKDSRATRWPKLTWSEFSIEQFSDDLQIGIYAIPPDIIGQSAIDDPFAVDGPKTRSDLPRVQAPPSLAPWVQGSVIDAGSLMDAPESSFYGYDERRQLLIYLASQAHQEVLRDLLQLNHFPFVPKYLRTRLDLDDSSWEISTASGSRGFIRKFNNGRETGVEIEPTASSDGFSIDCNYHFDFIGRGDVPGSLSSRITLKPGVPQVIGSSALPGGVENKVSLTATRPSP